jgi:Cupin domain
MSERPDFPPIRRIVTGHGPDGVPVVILDQPATNKKTPVAGVASTLIWSTDTMPTSIARGLTIEDMGERILGSAPAAHGTRFCVIDFEPGTPVARHRTDTLDYIIVLEGELDMLIDSADPDHMESIHLKAGDIMVQRGAYHAFVNRGVARARIAVVLVDAEPLGIGKPLSFGATAGMTAPH